MSGFPKFEGSQVLPEFPYAAYAELIGLKGIRLDNPEDIGAAWDEALSATQPVVIDAHTDPEIATLPPHISMEQAANFAKSILKGDPDKGAMIRQSYKQMLDGWMPHRRARKHEHAEEAG